MGKRAIFEHVFTLLAIGRHDAIADKAIADTARDGDFAKFAGKRHGGGKGRCIGLIGTNHFKQLHDMGRGKEMKPNHPFWMGALGGNFIDIKIGRVRCQNRIRLAMLGQFAKHIMFD